jgi:hypothetical protein
MIGQPTMEKIPSTRLATAMPDLGFGGNAGGTAPIIGGGADDAPPCFAAKSVLNSMKSASGFHSETPSTCTNVRAVTRPCRIQSRITSAVTGPYSF